jgi:hypothetical protein
LFRLGIPVNVVIPGVLSKQAFVMACQRLFVLRRAEELFALKRSARAEISGYRPPLLGVVQGALILGFSN